jgi:hypothetical protein
VDEKVTTSQSEQEPEDPPSDTKPPSSFLHVVLMVVIPAGCLLAAWVGLTSGAAVVFQCDRLTERVTEEATETRGIVTIPVERVIQEGRVDVTVRRKILGLVTWKQETLRDVVDADSSVSTHDVRNSRGSRTSSYEVARVTLHTRDGREWRSPEAAGCCGAEPDEIAEGIENFIRNGKDPILVMRWMPWLGNLVGIPFALISILLLWGLAKTAVRRSKNSEGL